MSTYEQATGRSIEEAFREFHTNNPKVYMFFSEQCFRAIRRGKNKISSKQLLGYIRWEVSLETNSDDGFKINDAFTSHYSRLFAKDYPEHEDIFNFRELRSGDSTEDDNKKKKKSKVTGYQFRLLTDMLNGEKLWFINTMHKMIHPETKIQRKVETRSVDYLEKINFIASEEKSGSDLFGAKEYSLTKKGNSFLTGGLTP